MKSILSRQGVLAAVAGLALAAISKLACDLLNGYALIPNLFLSFGLNPPPFVLEALLLISLLFFAFCIGTWLFKNAPASPGKSAVIAGLPWVALSVIGLIAGLQGGPWQREAAHPSWSSAEVVPQLLVALSIPVGLWLAVKRIPVRRAA